MKKNQRGFSVIESIMVVVIIILLGAVGYLFWDKIMNKPADSKTTASSSQSPSPSPTVSSKTYTAKTLPVVFDYPSTWSVTANTNSDVTGKVPTEDGSRDRLLVKSPNGFTLLFNTVGYGGLGGACPPTTVTNFSVGGKSSVGNASVIGYDSQGKYFLYLSVEDTAEAASNDSCHYNSIVPVAEPKMVNGEYVGAYAVMFGTIALGENPVSTVKPSDQDLKDAIAILKSLRKS